MHHLLVLLCCPRLDSPYAHRINRQVELKPLVLLALFMLSMIDKLKLSDKLIAFNLWVFDKMNKLHRKAEIFQLVDFTTVCRRLAS